MQPKGGCDAGPDIAGYNMVQIAAFNPGNRAQANAGAQGEIDLPPVVRLPYSLDLQTDRAWIGVFLRHAGKL